MDNQTRAEIAQANEAMRAAAEQLSAGLATLSTVNAIKKKADDSRKKALEAAERIATMAKEYDKKIKREIDEHR